MGMYGPADAWWTQQTEDMLLVLSVLAAVLPTLS